MIPHVQGDLFRPAYGTEPHKLVRSDAPGTSYAAAYGVDTTKLERLVHRTIAGFPNGCIAAEVLNCHQGKAYSSITARFRSLEEKGLIACGPETRRGPTGRRQRVMRSLVEPAE
jgi:hypothetical protein